MWNPNKSIIYFEPGSICCVKCGCRPDDPWADAPEGFVWADGEWLDVECLEQIKQEEGK